MTAVSGEPSARREARRVDPIDATAELPPIGDFARRPPNRPSSGIQPGRPQARGGRPSDDDPPTAPVPGTPVPGAPVPPNPAHPTYGPKSARRARPGPEAVDPATRPGINHLGSAAVAVLAGGALAVAADRGALQLLIAVAVVQGLLAISWVLGTGMPGRIGGIVVGGLAAAGADVVVSRWPHGQLGTLLGVLALVVPAMFVHQLTRGVVRARVTESLSDIAVLVVAVVALPALVQLRHETDGKTLVVVVVLAAAGALVAGHLVDAVVPRPRFDPAVSRGLLAVIVGIGVGAGVSYQRLHDTVDFTSGRAALLGAAVGGIVSLFAVGAAFVEQTSSAPGGPTRLLRPVFGVLLPLGLIAPVGYLLCLAIRG